MRRGQIHNFIRTAWPPPQQAYLTYININVRITGKNTEEKNKHVKLKRTKKYISTENRIITIYYLRQFNIDYAYPTKVVHVLKFVKSIKIGYIIGTHKL